MKSARILILFLSLAAMLHATDHQGITPRRSASDYPGHQEKQGLALGVALLRLIRYKPTL